MTQDWPEGIPSAEEMKPIFEDLHETTIPMFVGAFDLFCVLGALQLACRHPEFIGPSRDIVESFARQIETVIVEYVGTFGESAEHDMAILCAAGWDPAYDVDTKGE